MSNLPILQFLLTPGAGETALSGLLDQEALHPGAMDDLCRFDPARLSRTTGLGPGLAHSVIGRRGQAMAMAEKLAFAGITLLRRGDGKMPSRLAAGPDILFCKGNTALLSEASVGVAGSRHPSLKGSTIAEQCVESLVKKGLCIVSGNASGIDFVSSRKALEQGGRTILVLPNGILADKAIRTDLASLMTKENTLVVSQYAPLAEWNVGYAMRRNGTVISLSDAMLVVESGLNGGTYAAAEETLRRKVPLFVVEYGHAPESAAGNRKILGEGARPIRRGHDGRPGTSRLALCAKEKAAARLATGQKPADSDEAQGRTWLLPPAKERARPAQCGAARQTGPSRLSAHCRCGEEK